MATYKLWPSPEILSGFLHGKTDAAELPLIRKRSLTTSRLQCVSPFSCASQTPGMARGTSSNRKWGHFSADSKHNKTFRMKTYAQAVDVDLDLDGERIADDYYSVLGLTPDATMAEVKKSYYSCMKACHPDLSGNNPENVAFCQFVNEVYEVLSDPEMRALYDEINGYAATGINPFMDTSLERDHVFVDEFTCIGCKNCANTAESTFEIEPEFGRARVCSQTADRPALVQEAIDTCPVSCIYWVTAPQVTLLEDEMRRIERVNVAIMLSGQGNKGADIFAQASWRWQKRQAKAMDTVRMRKMKEKGKGSQWGDFWEPATAAQEPQESTSDRRTGRRYDKEKMAQAAAAARRWREYSRSGIDRRATRFIAAASADNGQRK